LTVSSLITIAPTMAQLQEQQAEFSYAVGQQHTSGTAQARSQPGTLAPLRVDNTLAEQCKTSSENLRLCIQRAQDVAANQADSIMPRLRPIKRRLDEHRLRLDIWISDCQVANGGLSAITIDKEPSLLRLLSESFLQFQKQLLVILRGIDQIGKDSVSTDSTTIDKRYHSHTQQRRI
jgi:hypothetical protein